MQQGVWTPATPIKLDWVKTKSKPAYSWEPTLSFIELEKALRKAIGFEYNSKIASEIACRNQESITKLTSLMCDCFGDAKPGACYTDSETTEAYFFVCTDLYQDQVFTVMIQDRS